MEKKAGVGGAQVWTLAIVRDRPGMSLTDVWKTLDAEGIRASKSTIYRLVFKRARGRP